RRFHFTTALGESLGARSLLQSKSFSRTCRFLARNHLIFRNMTKREKNLWQGIDPSAQNALSPRDYGTASFAQELAQRGVDAGERVAADRNQRDIKQVWIPGVEIFARRIHAQRHRGSFGEFVRRDEGILARIGLWPKQWSAARMFAHTAKGFHVHPPSVPEG